MVPIVSFWTKTKQVMDRVWGKVSFFLSERFWTFKKNKTNFIRNSATYLHGVKSGEFDVKIRLIKYHPPPPSRLLYLIKKHSPDRNHLWCTQTPSAQTAVSCALMYERLFARLSPTLAHRAHTSGPVSAWLGRSSQRCSAEQPLQLLPIRMSDRSR